MLKSLVFQTDTPLFSGSEPVSEVPPVNLVDCPVNLVDYPSKPGLLYPSFNHPLTINGEISKNEISPASLKKKVHKPELTYESVLEESHKLLGKLKQGSERNSTYPVDVRSAITLFEDLTGIHPPRKGEQSYPFWIKSMREVIKVCHEYSVSSVNAMTDFYEEYKRSGKRFKIITPSSIVKSLRAFLGEEKSEERKYRDVTSERLANES